MKIIDNLKIRNKFILMLFFPIVGLLYFAITEIVVQYQTANNMEQTLTLSTYGIKASNLVHELQKERGMTAGFLGSKGAKFANKLPEQRLVTNNKMDVLMAAIDELDSSAFSRTFNSIVKSVVADLNEIKNKRALISNFEIATPAAISYYTHLNGKLLNSISQIAVLSTNADISKQAAAYVNFLMSKERAGIERAVLANTFAAGKFAPNMYEKFNALVTEQQTYLNVFNSFASQKQQNYLKRTLVGNNVNEVMKYRKIAREKYATNSRFGVEAGDWFKAATGRINLLKQVEDQFSQDLAKTATRLNDEASSSFMHALIISIVAAAVTFIFSYLVVKGVTVPLTDALARMRDIAEGEGDLTKRIEVKSNDEVGKLARSFDFMERSIKLHIQQIEYISKLPGENPNPVFRVGKSGQVLYANSAATKNLKDWGLEVGSMLPSEFDELITDSMQSGESKTLEINHGGRILNFELMPVAESSYINIYGKDITERKIAEKQLEKITAEKNHMENEVKMATLVQEGFLPESPPEIQGYQFSAKTIPAQFVGGDFFDFILLDEKSLGMVLGDVSGKGVSAALYMAKLMSDFRYVSLINSDPGAVISQINYILSNRTRRGMFATAVFLLLDTKNMKLKLCNAGHHSLIILRNQKEFHEVGRAGGIPLGIQENASYSQEDIQLQSGDIAVLYSDGALEPVNKKNEQYGMERLQATLFESKNNSAEKILKNLEFSINAFTDNAAPFDDMTFLIFKVD